MNENLQRELEEIRGEVSKLNSRLNKLSSQIYQANMEEISQIPSQNSVPVEDSISINKVNKTEDKQVLSQGTNFTPLNYSKKSDIDLESKIGKNIMGIVASILIFLGILSFVSLALITMSDTIKLFLTYLFAFSLFSIGLYRVLKNKNSFSNSVLSCGIGSVYIALLLSCFYFNLFTDLGLFISMVIWSFITFSLYYKLQSGLYLVISYIGFAISLLLGGVSEYNESLVVIGLLFLLQGIYLLLLAIISKKINTENKLSVKFVYFIYFLMSFILLSLSCNNRDFILSEINMSCAFLIFSLISVFILNNIVVIKKFNKRSLSSCCLLIILLISNIFCMLPVAGNIGVKYNFEVKPVGYHLMDLKEKETGHLENYAANRLYLNDRFQYDLEDDNHSYENEYDYNYLSDEDFNHYVNEREYEQIKPYLDIQEKKLEKNVDFAELTVIFMLVANLVILVYLNSLNNNKFLHILEYIISVCIGFSILETNFFFVLNMFIGLIPIIIISYLVGVKLQDDSLKMVSIIFFMVSSLYGLSEHNLLYSYCFTVPLLLFMVLHLICLFVINKELLSKQSKLTDILLYLINIIGLFILICPLSDYISDILQSKHYLAFSPLSIYQDGVLLPEESESFKYNLGFVFSELAYFVYSLGYLIYVNYSVAFKDNLNKFRSKVLFVINKIYNNIVLMIGITLLYDINFNEPLRFITLLMCFGLCFIDIQNLIKSEKEWVGYYLSLKMTIFLNIVLYVFTQDLSVTYLYSILTLIIAVISIIIGFKLKKKSFRISGLWLSLFSSLKLVLIDISYDNSISRILSLIFSGLLCFGIVWVYNRMSESLKESNKGQDNKYLDNSKMIDLTKHN